MQRTRPEPERLQRRPAVSCTLCRKRKVRCDRESPCSSCVRSKSEPCVYESALSPSSQPRRDQTVELRPAPKALDIRSPTLNDQTSYTDRVLEVSTRPSAPGLTNALPSANSASRLSDREIDLMRGRIRQLEDELSAATQKTAKASVNPHDSHTGIPMSTTTATFTARTKSTSFNESNITGHIMYKSRLFGRSHWLNGATQFQDIFEIIEPYIRQEMSKDTSALQRCKYLAGIIKSQRTPPWPLTPTADLPPKDVADQLVDLYLRTTETIYRILHTPTFTRDYNALWVSGTKPDMSFIVQLKLVLAIGASAYDEHFSLRASAIRWVFEAQVWLSAPVFKSRLRLDALQTNLLFLIARETVDVGGELIWISAGALLRLATSMGLHRDPANLSNMTTLTAEMRRRLWNTVLEVTLQSSLDSGGPPFLSLEDFDTAPPSNLNDHDLMTDRVVAKPEDEFTQMSIAVSLRKIFPVRLAIAKFLNNIGSDGSYEETLRLDMELRAAYKSLYQTLQACKTSTRRSLSRFETCVVDMILCRYLSSLHIPFFGSSLDEASTAYAFSRKVVIETALKTWGAMNLFTCVVTSPSHMNILSLNQDDITRFMICSSGFFRTFAFQASFLVAAELRTLLQENNTLGLAPLRLDLLSVLDNAKTFTLCCIEAGDTNIKNNLLTCVIAAQVDALMQRVPKNELPQLLIKAAEDAVASCLSILERKAAQCREEAAPEAGAFSQMSSSMPNDPVEGWDPDDLMEGWDMLISDPQFDFSFMQPMT